MHKNKENHNRILLGGNKKFFQIETPSVRLEPGTFRSLFAAAVLMNK